MALGVVLREWPAPDAGSSGLCGGPDGTLYLNSNLTQLIYQLNKRDGTIRRSFPAPDNGTRDLIFDGRSLWVASTTAPDNVYQLNPRDGTIQRLWANTVDPVGLAWDERTVWVGDAGGTELQNIPQDGAVLRTWAAPAAAILGQAFNDRALWLSTVFTGLTHLLNPRDGTDLVTFNPAGQPRGGTLDGRTLWMIEALADIVRQYSLT